MVATVKKYDDFLLVMFFFIILTLASVATFIIFPTRIGRIDIIFDGLVGRLFKILYFMDGPNNLFPSSHVSSAVYISLVNGYFCPKSKIWVWILAVLISASTLFIKQHFLLDVVGGILFGLAAYVALRIKLSAIRA